MAVYGICAAAGYIVILFIGQAIIGKRRQSRHIKSREAPGKYILASTSSLMLALAMPGMRVQQPVWPCIVIGLAIMFLGLILTWWAHWELGQYWVGGIGLHRNQRLITTGPYRLVRHPLYSGMIVSALGLSIFGLNPFYAAMAFCFCGAFAVRVVGEEQELRRRFKKTYPAYAATTGMFLPRLRRKKG